MREIPSPILRDYTTLRLGGKAEAELVAQGIADLEVLPERLRRIGAPPLFIGHGSNILAHDGNLPLTLVRLDLGRMIKFNEQDDGRVLVHASADVPMPALLRACFQKGLSGLEGLVGIPGNVGGAVAMNAGSFGTETAALLVDAHIFCDGSGFIVNHADLKIKYRKIDFGVSYPDPLIIGATFALTKAPKNVIFSRMNLNFCEKKSRQPVTSKSAGCVFKNPPGQPAGKLLEMAGFRGRGFGGMSFSQKHANFLINEGNGCASAALDLLADARAEVKRLFGILLETEVRIVPWPLR